MEFNRIWLSVRVYLLSVLLRRSCYNWASPVIGNKVYNIIYIIVDRYTKIALYLPIVKTITVTKLIDLFLNKVVRYFRTPRGIISNYSSIFTSKL